MNSTSNGCNPVIANYSFETDTFPVAPGYISVGTFPSGNPTAITGWTWTPAPIGYSAAGINPYGPAPYSPAGGPYTWANAPFFFDGHTTAGNKVAFIQIAGTLSQNVSGFIVGANYTLSYLENLRISGATQPVTVTVTVGSATAVPSHNVVAVTGNANFTLITSQPFTATASSMYLSFIVATPSGGDITALIDNVVIVQKVN